MSDLSLPDTEVNDFLAKKKEIDGKMKWKNKGKAYLEWSSILLDEDGISIPTARIILTANQDEELYKFTFVIDYRGQNIRRLDIDDTHRRTNPYTCAEYPGVRIEGNHMHVWSQDNGINCAVPIDIPARDKTHREWFEFFLNDVKLIYNNEHIAPPLTKGYPRLF